MSTEHEDLRKRNVQSMTEWHAWRQPFIVRASLMFNVPTSEVTQTQYNAAYEETLRDTVPRDSKPTT